MFLQETKTKRGGKTYISYLVRESFRTANGPRGRTICNLTHLPKEVRDMVGQALKGESLVPLDRLEVNNIHCFGGCVVLEDAARRFGLPGLLAPLSPRTGALVQAMIFGGLLFSPSLAPFYLEAKSVRLAMFCGLDPEREHFELGDLVAALRELDQRWPQVCATLLLSHRAELRAVTLFPTSTATGSLEMGALGMDADGIPVPLSLEENGKHEAGLPGFLKHLARQSKAGPPLLALDEETAARLNHARAMAAQPYLIELGPDSRAALLRQLNHAQLLHALRDGRPVEVRHQGERYILNPIAQPQQEPQEASLRMGSIKDLAPMAAAPKPAEAGANSVITAFQAIHSNTPPERLPAATAIEWANRARYARVAFAPVHIVKGGAAAPSEPLLTWRNHQNLQFLTHRLRCHLQAEWRAHGETRPVEEVLHDLQEVHRATLTVDGVGVRRLATHPSKAVAALLSKLHLWDLFESTKAPSRVASPAPARSATAPANHH